MGKLLVKPRAPHGRVHHVTPASADWSYVGFDLFRLAAGEEAGAETGSREVCLVLIAGRAEISAGDEAFGVIGERLGPFGGKPWSVYVPAGTRWRAVAKTPLELAVCSSPGKRASGRG